MQNKQSASLRFEKEHRKQRLSDFSAEFAAQNMTKQNNEPPPTTSLCLYVSSELTQPWFIPTETFARLNKDETLKKNKFRFSSQNIQLKIRRRNSKFQKLVENVGFPSTPLL